MQQNSIVHSVPLLAYSGSNNSTASSKETTYTQG